MTFTRQVLFLSDCSHELLFEPADRDLGGLLDEVVVETVGLNGSDLHRTLSVITG